MRFFVRIGIISRKYRLDILSGNGVVHPMMCLASEFHIVDFVPADRHHGRTNSKR